MPRFRKKPVVIDAIQHDGSPQRELEVLAVLGRQGSVVEDGAEGTNIVIRTLEGDMVANVGDWIITGVNGEHYPCKPDIFEKTYERVE